MLRAALSFLTTKIKWWNVWVTVIVSLIIFWTIPEAFWRVWICIFVSDLLFSIADEYYKS